MYLQTTKLSLDDQTGAEFDFHQAHLWCGFWVSTSFNGCGEQITEQTVHYYQKQMGAVLPSCRSKFYLQNSCWPLRLIWVFVDLKSLYNLILGLSCDSILCFLVDGNHKPENGEEVLCT